MKLRAGRGADSGASAFAHFFGRKKAEEETPSEDPKPKDEGEGGGEDDEREKEEEDAEPAAGEEDEELKDGAGPGAKARARERGRISAILGHEKASKAPALALHLALETDLPRGQAMGLLAAGAIGVAGGLDTKMQGQAPPRIAPDAPPPSAKAEAMAGWNKAFASAGIATNSMA